MYILGQTSPQLCRIDTGYGIRRKSKLFRDLGLQTLRIIHKTMVKSSVNEENLKKAVVTGMTDGTGKRMMISGEQ